MSPAASQSYGDYHRTILTAERMTGKMMASLVGISERVSPDEIDRDSLYSVYHRTLEWNQKKEIGVMVFNAYPESVKSFIRFRVATGLICAYNSQKMKVRQQITRIEEDLWEIVVLVKVNSNGYSSYILRYCEGQERDEGLAVPINGKFFDGDAYRLEFDETGLVLQLSSPPGRFRNVTAKLDNVLYQWENEICVMKTKDGRVQPSDLSPDDPKYYNSFLSRYVSPQEPLSFSALRGPLLNVMIQRYSSAVTVITRVIKSVSVSKKTASRGHLIDQSILLSAPVSDGDLVLVSRLEDIHNNLRVHVDLNGRGMQVRQGEAIPSDETALADWASRRREEVRERKATRSPSRARRSFRTRIWTSQSRTTRARPSSSSSLVASSRAKAPCSSR